MHREIMHQNGDIRHDRDSRISFEELGIGGDLDGMFTDLSDDDECGDFANSRTLSKDRS